MDPQTLGIIMIVGLPLAGVGLFVWGHKHGVKSVNDVLTTLGYKGSPPGNPPTKVL